MPEHSVVTLLDDSIYDYPFVFMSDVATVGFTPIEVERLCDYLSKGGILYMDDFWGEAAWAHWKHQIGQVLPQDAYPIVDIPSGHTISRTFFAIREIPQIPSIRH